MAVGRRGEGCLVCTGQGINVKRSLQVGGGGPDGKTAPGLQATEDPVVNHLLDHSAWKTNQGLDTDEHAVEFEELMREQSQSPGPREIP